MKRLDHKTTKKFLAMLLSVTIVFSSIPFSTVYSHETETVKTLSTVLAENYSETLTTAEIAFLKDIDALTGDSFTYTVPDTQNSDGYVTVDAEAKTVTITNTNEFEAVGAYVVVENERVETITITNNEGSFTYDEQIYSIEVDYEYNADVKEETQSTLLEAVYYLSEAMDNFDTVAGLESDIDTILSDDFLGTLYEFAIVGYTATVATDTDTPYDITITWSDSSLSQNYVVAMYEEKQENGSLDIQDYINAYQDSDSKVKYILENGEEFKETIEAFSIIMTEFVSDNDGSTKNIITTASTLNNGSYASLATVANGIMKTVAAGLENVVAGVWSVDENDELDYDKYFQDTITSYSEMDALVAAALDNTSYDDVIISENLLIDTVTVTANVAQYNVNVTVSAYEYIDGVKTDLTSYKTTIALPENATSGEIEEAIKEDAVEATAVTAWGINTAYYDVTVTGIETLTKDITVSIEYTPKTYTITYTGENTDKPTYEYGETFVFASHSDIDISYDYTAVDGTIYNQGDTYTVTGDVSFDVSEGKAKTENTIKELVAETYADELGDYADILTNPAIYSDTVKIRVPSDMDGDNETLLVLDEANGTITAQSYSSGVEGSTWVPKTAYVVTGSNSTSYPMSEYEVGKYIATFNDTDYDKVEVEYELEISEDVVSLDIIQEYLNIPYDLASDLKTQIEHMDILAGQKDSLNSIPASYLSTLNSLIKDEDRGFTQDSIDAMANIIAVALNNDKELVLLDYISGYESNGIIYYYENYEAIINQVDVLYTNLKTIIDNDKDKLITLIDDMDIDGYDGEELVEKLENAITELEKVQLVEPNTDVINLSSSSLSTLLSDLATIINQPTTMSVDVSDGAVTADTPITVTTKLNQDASGKATITVVVQQVNSDGDVLKTYTDSHTVSVDGYTASDITAIETIVNDLKANISSDYYDVSSYTLPTTTDTVASQSITITYSPKKYIVNDGTDSYSFYYDNPVITLSIPTTSDVVYDYLIDDATTRVTSTSTNTYRFTDEQISRLFATGEYEITKTEVSVYREDILEFVEALNDHDATYTDGGNEYLQVSYIPVEDEDGNISIIARISPTSTIDTESIFSSIASAILDGGYTYVEIGGETLLDGTTISIQALIDALLNSDIGLSSISNVIDENGDIVEMTLEDDVLTEFSNIKIADIDTYGGEILSTTITLGEGGTETTLYLSLEDFDKQESALSDLKTAIDTVRNTIDITAEEGTLKIELDLSDKYYTAYSAWMLLTDNADIQDFNADLSDDELSSILEENYDILSPLFDEDVTLDYIENTLNDFMTSPDFSSYETVYDLIKQCDIEFVSSIDNVVNATISYDVSSLLDSFGSYASAITLAEDEIVINAEITFKNYEKDYEALIINTSSLTSTTITSNLSTATISSGSTVILLSDVTGNLTFSGTSTLDLNGYTVTGAITTTGSLSIIDSHFTSRSGEVTGSLKGDITVYAGKYSTLDESMIPANYEQGTDGYVVNEVFTITETETEINIELSAEVINSLAVSNVSTLTMPLIYDIILNYYMNSSLSIGENELYSVEIDDVANYELSTLAECLDLDGVNGFIDEILTALSDFETVATAIENGDAIVSFKTATTSWELELEANDTDEKLEFNITTSDASKSGKTINITIGGDADEIDQTVAMFEALADTTELNVTLDIESLDYNNSELSYEYSLNLAATVDLTGNDNYAYMLGIMINSEEENSDIQKAIEEQDIKALQEAIDEVDTQTVIDAIENAASVSYADMMTGFSTITYDYETEYTTLYYLAGHIFKGFFKQDLSGKDFGDYSTTDYGTYKLVDDTGITTYELNLAIFAEQIDYVVATDKDGTVVYQGTSLVDAFATSGVTKITISNSVSLTNNVTISSDIEIVGASKINFGSYKLTIASEGVTIKTDSNIKSYIATSTDYTVVVTGTYNYTIEYITPEIIKTTLTTSTSGLVRGATVDETNSIITIDVSYAGITSANLKTLISSTYTGKTITSTIGSTTSDGLVKTGSTYKVTVTNAIGETATKTYTIIVLGDVNSDGKSNAFDSYTISQIALELSTPTTLQSLAGDMDQSGTLTAFDCYYIIQKSLYEWDPETYVSKLK